MKQVADLAIELTPTHLTFSTHAHQTIHELAPWITSDQKLFGLSELKALLTAYLEEQNLTRPTTLIYAPIEGWNDPAHHPYLLLQICLCFCATPIKLVGVFKEPLLERELVMKAQEANVFRLFFPFDRSGYRTWLRGSLVALGLAAIGMATVTTVKLSDIALLSSQHHPSEDTKDQAHALHCLDDMHNELDNELQTLSNLEKANVPPVTSVLKSLTVSITKRTWLSRVSLTHNPAGHGVAVQGFAPSHSDVSRIVRTVSQTQVFSQLAVHSIQSAVNRQPRHPDTTLSHFDLRGTVNTPQELESETIHVA